MRADLRRSFRCGCGPERSDRNPHRVTRGGEHDIGEQILKDCEDASGERPIGCPWSAFADPFVREVVRWHRHWRAGAVDVHSLPAVIVKGIETYDAALNGVQVNDMREDRAEREKRRRQEELSRQR